LKQLALLSDDRAARRHAAELGLVVVGTVGVRTLAKRRALLSELRPLIERLRTSGDWLSEETVRAALLAAGEPLQ
jgi:predicted nucleic acid-binding protein